VLLQLATNRVDIVRLSIIRTLRLDLVQLTGELFYQTKRKPTHFKLYGSTEPKSDVIDITQVDARHDELEGDELPGEHWNYM
jgi:hypothetical protein